MGLRVARQAMPAKRGAAGSGETASLTQQQRWFQMASAMDKALDNARTMWLTVRRLQDLHKERSCEFCHEGNWKPLLDELEATANLLRCGLKARPSRMGSNRK
jgi:hypothetical protein